MPFHFASFHFTHLTKQSKYFLRETICIGHHVTYAGTFGPSHVTGSEHFGGHHGNLATQITNSTQIPTGWWLAHPSEKYESQLGYVGIMKFPIYGKHVPNHQPA
jgi:hypothetical protein